MRTSVFWAIILTTGTMVAAAAPGERDAVVVALAVLSLVAWLNVALRLVLRGLVRLLRRPAPRPAGTRRSARPRVDTRRRIVVDGSNVMFWDRETPTLGALTAVLDALIARDLAPVVYFDANAGYQLFDAFAGAYAMAQHLPDGVAEVIVVDKGDPADPILIAAALKDDARIVSNDRFRDWRGQFPRLADKGLLVQGEMRGGTVRLRL